MRSPKQLRLQCWTYSSKHTSPDEVEITKAVRRLKNGKAAGICNIPAEVLKSAGKPMICWMRDMFGLVWNSEEISEDWRRDIILALYKGKGLEMNCANFRGITLLFVPGKVFVHILDCIKLLVHLKHHQEPAATLQGGKWLTGYWHHICWLEGHLRLGQWWSSVAARKSLGTTTTKDSVNNWSSQHQLIKLCQNWWRH